MTSIKAAVARQAGRLCSAHASRGAHQKVDLGREAEIRQVLAMRSKEVLEVGSGASQWCMEAPRTLRLATGASQPRRTATAKHRSSMLAVTMLAMLTVQVVALKTLAMMSTVHRQPLLASFCRTTRARQVEVARPLIG